ncbi:hypothetical protein TNCT_693021, partial [Trichonephila clavata]
MRLLPSYFPVFPQSTRKENPQAKVPQAKNSDYCEEQ